MKWFSCVAPSATLDKDEAHRKFQTNVLAASPFASQSPPSRTDVDRERRTLSFTLTPTHPDTAPPPPPNPPEGVGVRLPDGSAYFGEINKDGKMHGRGVFVWPDGDRYEGEWLDGLQKGIGTFISSAGGAYFGNWEAGQPHGRGVFRPAPSPSPSPIVTATATTTTADDNLGHPLPPPPPQEPHPHPHPHPHPQHQQPTMLNDNNNNIVYLREYRHGELLNEEVLRIAEQDVRKGSKEKKEDRKKAREVVGATSSGISSRKKYTPPRSGERIYKNHPSYELMRELQLGLMFSMAQGWPKTGKLLKESFEEEVVQWFPMSSGTPPFKWKSYAPSVFHRLRELFGIDNTDYLLSLTGEAALRELPTPGRSGSMFYLSDDDRFLVKTVRKEEMRLLLRMIEQYHDYVCDHSHTLLAKFLGIHRVSPWGGRNIRFIVMGNVLPSDLRLHRRYDLKGSSYGRTVGEERRRTDPDVTLQDNDLDMHFVVAPALRERLLAQLRQDCEFLTSLKSIDYSLLLGVHFLCWGNGEWHPPGEPWPDGGLSPRLVLPLYSSPSLANRQYSTESNAFDANITDGGDDGGGGGGESPDAASMLAQHQHCHQHMNISNTNSRMNSLTMTQEEFLSSYKLSNMSDTDTGGAALTQKHQHQQHTPLASSSTMSTTPYVSDPLPVVAVSSGQQLLQQERDKPGGTVHVTPTAHPLTTALSLPPPNITTDTAITTTTSTIVPSRRPTLLRSITKDGAGWGGRLNSLREARKLAALMQAGGPELAHAAVLLEDANSARDLARKSAANASAYISAATAASAASTNNGKADGNDGTDGNIAADGHVVPHNSEIVLNVPVAKKPMSLGFTTTTISSRPASPTTKFSKDTTKSDGNGSKGPASRGVAVPLYVPYWKSDTYSEQLELAMASPSPPSPSPVKRQTIATNNSNKNRIGGGMKEDEGPLSWSASMMMRNRDGGGGGGAADIFGRAVPAMAVSKAGGHAEPVLLFFGIIDFLQSYTARKMVERAFKATIHDGDAVSVANPKLYSERFMHAMEKILVSDTLQ